MYILTYSHPNDKYKKRSSLGYRSAESISNEEQAKKRKSELESKGYIVSMQIKEVLLESKDLNLYKRLLRILGMYCKSVPCTGVDKLFDQAVEQGKQVLPKDKAALAILDYILCEKDVSNTVQTLLNLHFSCLPVEIRPISKKGRRHEVAFWSQGDQKSDRVKDLLDLEGSGKAGKWVDINGAVVQLIDMSSDEKKE
jgi:hypothetical protein